MAVAGDHCTVDNSNTTNEKDMVLKTYHLLVGWEENQHEGLNTRHRLALALYRRLARPKWLTGTCIDHSLQNFHDIVLLHLCYRLRHGAVSQVHHISSTQFPYHVANNRMWLEPCISLNTHFSLFCCQTWIATATISDDYRMLFCLLGQDWWKRSRFHSLHQHWWWGMQSLPHFGQTSRLDQRDWWMLSSRDGGLGRSGTLRSSLHCFALQAVLKLQKGLRASEIKVTVVLNARWWCQNVHWQGMYSLV